VRFTALIRVLSPIGGRVNKIGTDYVGLLVLGVFNAAVGRLNIRSDFVYQPLVSGCRIPRRVHSAALQVYHVGCIEFAA
jgi:hypothetical protein